MPDRTTVLFVCTHNSARSQMAEGLLRARHGDRYDAYSAGTERTHVRPLATEALAELGIDLSTHRSQTVEDVLEERGGEPFDVVVTVCDNAREACPYVPARREAIHQSFSDPSRATGPHAEQLATYRTVRDAIADWIDDAFGGDSFPVRDESSVG